MSYRCNECDEVFEEPYEHKTSWEQYYGVAGDFPDRNRIVIQECPYCGSDDIEEYCDEKENE